MLLEEADRDTFKQWIVPKLEKISDADAGVLADYVIALVIADESEDAVKNNCLDSLSDFLQDPKPFVDQVIKAVKDRSYLPRSKSNPKPVQFSPTSVAPITSTPVSGPRTFSTHVSTSTDTPTTTPAIQRLFPSSLSAEAPPFNPPTGPAATLRLQPHLPDRPSGPSPSLQAHITGVGAIQNGRGSLKRKLKDRDSSRSRDDQDPHYKRSAGGDKPVRQTAQRGGRDSQRGNNLHGLFPGARPGLGPNVTSMTPMPNLPAMPLPPPGLPSFNPAEPMSFLTMAAALGMGLPGIVQMPFGSPSAMGLPRSNGQPHLATRKEQCNDYVTKGFCVLGSVCPYQHGGEVIQSTDEYDPENASLTVKLEKSPDKLRNRRHRNDAESRFGGRTRAPFSEAGPTTDRTNSTIVVEQIPEEHFSEDAVRDFFSQFGDIVSIEMQGYKRLAIVKYNDHFAACRAYDSPKVIFDNRFVKVYWLKSDSSTEPLVNGKNTNVQIETSTEQPLLYDQDEEMLDAEEIEKRQAEAQIVWEERQKKIQEAAAKLEDVQEKIKAKEAEIRELRKKVAEKDGVEFVDESQDTSLMEQLKSLQAEALDLGLNSQVQGESFAARWRGRGGYRGRFSTRARGAPFRGGYRGRGAPYIPAGARTSVKRLDNRTKRLAVTSIESGSPKDEALRQHLLNGYELDGITSHPTEEHTLIISFKERYMAEMFLDESLRMPDVGKLELSWVFDDLKGKTAASKQRTADGEVMVEEVLESTETGHDGDDAKVSANGREDANGGDNDYDVADDVDEWL